MNSLQELLTQAAGGTVDDASQDPVEPQDPQNQQDPDQDPVEPAGSATSQEPQDVKDDNKDPKDPDDPNKTKKNNPVKEIRDRLNLEQKAKEKIENAIQRFTEGSYNFKIKDFKTEDGKVDYDALIAAMDKADVTTRAENKGVSPEVQMELERIQQEKLELQKERLRVSMDRALSNMQVDMQLSREDINTFFKDSLALQHNPYQWLAQGGALEDLYYLVYRERLTKESVDKAVEEAKAKWDSDHAKKAPASNPASPAIAPTESGISLNQLLTSAAKK